MAWESCILLLNSDSTGSFYSGDIVTGSVILEFKREQKIEHIDFEVIGTCKAQWTRPMPTIPYIKIYSEKKEVLYYDMLDVFSELNGKVVKPGIHNFHFHFFLPADLPSTFESPIAKVNYIIKIIGKRPYKFSKQKTVPFVVQGNVNLNHLPDYLEPIFVECQKRLWNSGSVSICFKTFKGFSPKQQVPFEVVVCNEKKIKISKLNVILVQKVRYTVTSGYADDEKKVGKVTYNKFSNTVTETCHFEMEIPQTVPSSIYISDPMINVSYVLRVEMIFPFHTTLYEDVPVTVSTIPVMHYNDVAKKLV